MSSITSPPAKILLSSSTKISLNDRFAKLAKVKVQKETATVLKVESSSRAASASSSSTSPLAVAAPQVRLANPQASSRNQRLALQMASRPTVRAALQIKRKSIRQRIGGIQTGGIVPQQLQPHILQQQQQHQQLLLPPQPLPFDPSRLSVNGRAFNDRNLNQRLSRQGNINNRLAANRGNWSPRFKQYQPAAGGYNGGQRVWRVGAYNGNNSGRGGARQSGGPGRINKRASFGNRSFNRGGGRGGQRNIGGGGNKNRAAGPKKPGSQTPKSRENLDMDLDQYMAKTKSHLDHDLDTYMSQSGAN